MAVQDDHMIRNIQDVGRLIAKLLLHEQQPNYKLPEKEADYTEADRLFATIMKPVSYTHLTLPTKRIV